MRRVGAHVLVGALLLAACESGHDQLLASLQSVRPEERALAIRKLAEKARPDDLILFTRATKDPSATVRGEAAGALAKSQDPRVVDLLGELLGDSDESVQERAAMALAEFHNEKAKTYLTSQYARRGRSTREAIVTALGKAKIPNAMGLAVAAEARSLWDRTQTTLKEGDLAERVAAAEELGKSGRPEAVDRLLALTKDTQVLLATGAVRGLGHAGDPKAVEPVAALLEESFPELREAAIGALVRLNDPRALPQLRAVALEKSAASSVATSAIAAFADSDAARSALCEVITTGARADALAAAKVMRTRGGCPVAPIIEKLSRHSEQDAALVAIEGLGPVAKDALPKILPLIAGSDKAVRLAAIRAAGEVGDPSAADAVSKAYEQEQKALEPLRADWITAKLPTTYQAGFDPSAAPASPSEDPNSPAAFRQRKRDLFAKARKINEEKLAEAGKTAQPSALAPREVIDDVPADQLQTLAACLKAMGQLHAKDAKAALLAHRDETSATVRQAAFTGLAALGPEGVAEAKEGLVDPSAEVRSATANALAEAGEAGQAAIAEMLPKLASDRLPLLNALERAPVSAALTQPLIGQLREGGPEAAVASELLGRLHAKEAAPALRKLLDDPALVGRREVIGALGAIGDPSSAEAISAELFSDGPEVRAAAADALATLGKCPKPDALAGLSEDYYRRVREAASHALQRCGQGAAATTSAHP